MLDEGPVFRGDGWLKTGLERGERRACGWLTQRQAARVARRQLPCCPIKCAGGRHKPIHEVLVERLGAQVYIQQAAPAGGGKLTREPPHIAGRAHVQGLDACRISR